MKRLTASMSIMGGVCAWSHQSTKRTKFSIFIFFWYSIISVLKYFEILEKSLILCGTYFFNPYSAGIDFSRQILMSKVCKGKNIFKYKKVSKTHTVLIVFTYQIYGIITVKSILDKYVSFIYGCLYFILLYIVKWLYILYKVICMI